MSEPVIGAAAVIDALVAQGVRDVFGIPGRTTSRSARVGRVLRVVDGAGAVYSELMLNGFPESETPDMAIWFMKGRGGGQRPGGQLPGCNF